MSVSTTETVFNPTEGLNFCQLRNNLVLACKEEIRELSAVEYVNPIEYLEIVGPVSEILIIGCARIIRLVFPLFEDVFDNVIQD
jgi:hypothetical protein